jgi:hypothetical protein
LGYDNSLLDVGGSSLRGRGDHFLVAPQDRSIKVDSPHSRCGFNLLKLKYEFNLWKESDDAELFATQQKGTEKLSIVMNLLGIALHSFL